MIDSRFNESAWVLRTSGSAMTAQEVCKSINAQLGRSWSDSEISRALDELVRNGLASTNRAGYQWIASTSG
jgi:predicted transcriptional regulator